MRRALLLVLVVASASSCTPIERRTAADLGDAFVAPVTAAAARACGDSPTCDLLRETLPAVWRWVSEQLREGDVSREGER